jgi:hypothetical protein
MKFFKKVQGNYKDYAVSEMLIEWYSGGCVLNSEGLEKYLHKRWSFIEWLIFWWIHIFLPDNKGKGSMRSSLKCVHAKWGNPPIFTQSRIPLVNCRLATLYEFLWCGHYLAMFQKPEQIYVLAGTDLGVYGGCHGYAAYPCITRDNQGRTVISVINMFKLEEHEPKSGIMFLTIPN